MATLITVHGTFATGPIEGRSWWQYGSPFTMRLAMLLQADSDPITLDPFVWNGLNSESARRAAGGELAAKLVALEGRGELRHHLLMGTAVCLTWIFNKAAQLVSHELSLALNPLTVSQLKAARLRSDMQEAFAVDTAE